jgi:hypothetical protein
MKEWIWGAMLVAYFVFGMGLVTLAVYHFCRERMPRLQELYAKAKTTETGTEGIENTSTH